MTISVFCLDLGRGLTARRPNLFFTPDGIKKTCYLLRKLLRKLNGVSDVDAIYSELLHAFTENGLERRQSDFDVAEPWMTFLSITEREV